MFSGWMGEVPRASRTGKPRLFMEIALYNRQRKVAVPLPWLRRFAPVALAEVLRRSPGPGPRSLGTGEVEELEVTLVSDATIDRLHREFMQIKGATDVITFHHGEVVISTETAQANAPLYGRSVRDEIALYLVHGLLHLHGYGDKSPEEAAVMQREQEAVLATSLSALSLS